MGQQHSGFVVEIASPRLGRFQPLPQKDPGNQDEDEMEKQLPEWRITVNPAAELFGSDKLRALLDRLYQQQRLLGVNDARQLCAALHCMDAQSELLLPLLTMLMREQRITQRVVELLCQKGIPWARSCRVMLLQCVANMAVASDNQPLVRAAIPAVVHRIQSTKDEMEMVVGLQALTNLSLHITSDQVPQLTPAIAPCLARLWTRGEANLNALRLLVNLCCCPDMVPHVLGSKAVVGLLRILDSDKEEVLLRAITWLLCTSSAVDALQITPERLAPYIQDPFRNPQHTLYYCIYGPQSRMELEKRASELTANRNREIAGKAARLLEILRSIPPLSAYGTNINRLL